MRRVLIPSIALSSLVLIGGCANEAKEQNRLLTDRNTSLQAEVESAKSANAAATGRIESLEKQIAELKTEVETAKQAAATAQSEGAQKLKEADNVAEKRIADLKTASDTAAKAAAAQIKELNDKFTKANTELNSVRELAASQGKVQADRVAALTKQVQDLEKENESLKSAAATAKAAPATTNPAP